MNNPAPTDIAPVFANRELSQISFNARVLDQALDKRIPLLERLRFLCISCTNLDEFFEIRAGNLTRKIGMVQVPGPDGRTPQQVLDAVHDESAKLVRAQYSCWQDVLAPALAAEGIRVLKSRDWDAATSDWLRTYFNDEVMPVLSPLGLDPAHPFPKILNESLNLVVLVEGRDAFGREGGLAIVRAPRSLPRIIRIPESVSGGKSDFVFLSSILSQYVSDLFPGMTVNGAYQFRVTRNSELFVDEEEVEDIAIALRDELAGRGYLRAVRLEIDEACPDEIVGTLLENFELTENAVYRINGPVNLNRVSQVIDLAQRPDLLYGDFNSRKMEIGDDLFHHVRDRDILLHHPYDSFSTVIELLRQASVDPDVLAIKQTLYRAGKGSPIVDHLIQAARNGKDVTVVVELRARFDEEANLDFADRLQEAGVQVVYGVVGYKTHAKMMLIVRREANQLRRYVHLGTGNYHSGTARVYTDFGLITANPDIGRDVHLIFQQLSGLAPAIQLHRLLQSPFTLHSGLIERIEREAEHARAGRPARLIAKMNALNETKVIRALYAASQAGVQIDLIVRGACTLQPGIQGISENIRVRSIVGRFLEHHRVYWFRNDGDSEIYCSSADWLERNLLRRVETAFPILDPILARRVYEESLENYLRDNQNAYELLPDGTYTRVEVEPGEQPFSAQMSLLAQTVAGHSA